MNFFMAKKYSKKDWVFVWKEQQRKVKQRAAKLQAMAGRMFK